MKKHFLYPHIFHIILFFIYFFVLFPYFLPFSISGPRCIMLLKINPYNSNFFYSIIQYPCTHSSRRGCRRREPPLIGFRFRRKAKGFYFHLLWEWRCINSYFGWIHAEVRSEFRWIMNELRGSCIRTRILKISRVSIDNSYEGETNLLLLQL